MNIQEFLTSFDKMITPTIIKIIFWIGCGLSVLAGLGAVGAGLFSPFGGGIMVVYGLLMIVFGPLLVRVYCELIIVAFKMYEAMNDIRHSLVKGGTQGGSSIGTSAGQ